MTSWGLPAGLSCTLAGLTRISGASFKLYLAAAATVGQLYLAAFPSSDRHLANPYFTCLTCLSKTTKETLATEREEPATKPSNWGPATKDACTTNWPWYCQQFDALFINTGTALVCRVKSSLTGLVRAPLPHNMTSGACGLNFLLRHAATIAPRLVGRQDTLLPPNCAWISARVYSRLMVNMAGILKVGIGDRNFSGGEAVLFKLAAAAGKPLAEK